MNFLNHFCPKLVHLIGGGMEDERMEKMLEFMRNTYFRVCTLTVCKMHFLWYPRSRVCRVVLPSEFQHEIDLDQLTPSRYQWPILLTCRSSRNIDPISVCLSLQKILYFFILHQSNLYEVYQQHSKWHSIWCCSSELGYGIKATLLQEPLDRGAGGQRNQKCKAQKKCSPGTESNRRHTCYCLFPSTRSTHNQYKINFGWNKILFTYIVHNCGAAYAILAD